MDLKEIIKDVEFELKTYECLGKKLSIQVLEKLKELGGPAEQSEPEQKFCEWELIGGETKGIWVADCDGEDHPERCGKCGKVKKIKLGDK